MYLLESITASEFTNYNLFSHDLRLNIFRTVILTNILPNLQQSTRTFESHIRSVKHILIDLSINY